MKSRYTLIAWGATQAEAVAKLASKHTGAVIYRDKKHPIVAVVAPWAAGKFMYAVWSGNSVKPVAYFTAADQKSALDNVKFYWVRLANAANHKAEQAARTKERRANLKASDYFTAGDVLTNTWGYEQTNVDFYQVTKVSPRSIKIRKLAKNSAGTMTGVCQPDRFNFKGEEITKHLSESGTISFDHGGCRKWDGRPVSFTAYH